MFLILKNSPSCAALSDSEDDTDEGLTLSRYRATPEHERDTFITRFVEDPEGLVQVKAFVDSALEEDTDGATTFEIASILHETLKKLSGSDARKNYAQMSCKLLLSSALLDYGASVSMFRFYAPKSKSILKAESSPNDAVRALLESMMLMNWCKIIPSGISTLRVDTHCMEFSALYDDIDTVLQKVREYVDNDHPGGAASVRRLDFSRNHITTEAIKPLSNFVTDERFTSLEVVDLSQNRITRKDLAVFLELLRKPNFKFLNLADNIIPDLYTFTDFILELETDFPKPEIMARKLIWIPMNQLAEISEDPTTRAHWNFYIPSSSRE
ncbi:MAG: hypothetical protein HOL16_02045 [Alphaproteobacteria bacterium]|jgi:hypothetical protein|nr:hypothetical protein [Alphaproteobacteria bacterium]